MKRFTLAITLLCASMGAQASFDGATVQATYYFPELNNIFDQQQAVVGPGVEFTNFPAGDPRTNIDFSADNIYITYNSASSWSTATFNGEFFDSLSEITPIEGVTINEVTNMVGLTSDRIDWTSTSVSINWNGLAFDTSTVVSLDVAFAGAGTAHFPVSKNFSNGADDEVEVTLTCNGGLPLQQSFTISGGDPAGVTFTVTNLPDGGADCTVTESSGPDGYTSDSSNCAWTGVTGGVRSCVINNIPEPTTLMVDTEVLGVEDPNIDTSFVTTISCDNVSPDTGSTFGTATVDDTTGAFTVDWYAEPGETSDCTVTMTPNSSVVEGDSCTFSFALGDAEAGCDVAGTVFFEGIPTLSQYGMALMALLMLGVGFVGFRRFI